MEIFAEGRSFGASEGGFATAPRRRRFTIDIKHFSNYFDLHISLHNNLTMEATGRGGKRKLQRGGSHKFTPARMLRDEANHPREKEDVEKSTSNEDTSSEEGSSEDERPEPPQQKAAINDSSLLPTTESDRKANLFCQLCDCPFPCTFPNQKASKDHIKTSPAHFSLKCQPCQKQFISTGALKKHKKACPTQQKLKGNTFCKLCDCTFPDQNALNEHIKTSPAHFSLKCQPCQKQFISTGALKKHKKACPTQQKLKGNTFCKLCDCTFPDQNALNEHIKTSPAHFSLKCQPCQKQFISTGALKKHKKACPTQQKLKGNTFCKLCDCTFPDQNALNEHIKTSPAHFSLKCQPCQKQFISTSALDTHEKALHPPFCKLCDCTFPDQYALKEHIKTSPAHVLDCWSCQKRFTSTIELNRHEKALHPPFCKHCDCTFPNQKALREHIKTSPAHFSLKCQPCQKQFISTSALDTHEKALHPPFCKLCDCTFPNQKALREHIKTSPAHLSLIFCKLCDCFFPDRFALKEHITTSPAHVLQCRSCTKRCISTSALGWLENALRPRPINPCAFCSKNVPEHLEDGGQQGRISNISCPLCGYTFPDQSALKQHIKTSPAHILLECQPCKKRFISISALGRHKQTHHAQPISTQSELITNLFCKLCDCTFPDENAAKEHIKTSPAHVLECQSCQKQCSSIIALDMHEKALHPPPINPCPFCLITLPSRPTALLKHLEDGGRCATRQGLTREKIAALVGRADKTGLLIFKHPEMVNQIVEEKEEEQEEEKVEVILKGTRPEDGPYGHVYHLLRFNQPRFECKQPAKSSTQDQFRYYQCPSSVAFALKGSKYKLGKSGHWLGFKTLDSLATHLERERCNDGMQTFQDALECVTQELHQMANAFRTRYQLAGP
ncbi:hypothetical protein DFS34DRAFT_684356 [Phlyctochytrium arcticum]|nr:hypothetical protein DFS34DRAFT_684356 [Phlyctochytrium arcticum]